MDKTILQQHLNQAKDAINSALQLLDDENPDQPQATTITITVASPKVNAFFAPETNASGYPIMELFPSSTSPIAKRVQYKSGDRLLVFESPIRADGGAVYYQIAEPIIRNRSGDKILYTKLYLRAKDTRL